MIRFRFERYLTFASILCLLVASRMVFAPLLLPLERDLGLTHAVATSFFLVLSVGYSASLVLSGFLAARIQHRDMILLGCAVNALGLGVVALSRDLAVTYLGLGLTGVSTGLYFPSGIASIYELAGDRERGRAIGVHEVGASLAFVAVPLLTLAASGGRAWRVLLGLMAAASVALGVAHRLVGQGGRRRAQAPRWGSLRELFRLRAFRATVALFALILAAGTGAFSVLPAYLATERGMAERTVNLVLSLSRLTGLPVAFLAGMSTDRVRPRLTLALVLGGAGACTLLTGLARGGLLVGSLFLGPLLTGAFFPIAFSLMPTIIPPHLTALAVSLAMPAGYLAGAGLVPALLGILGQAGAFWVGYVVLGVLLAAGTLLVRRLEPARAVGSA